MTVSEDDSYQIVTPHNHSLTVMARNEGFIVCCVSEDDSYQIVTPHNHSLAVMARNEGFIVCCVRS